MLMAVIDQSLGDSTSRCSKMLLPLASVMLAVRSSHSTSSYAETPARVKYRGNFNPGAASPACPDVGCCVCTFVFSFIIFTPVSAISFFSDSLLCLRCCMLHGASLPARFLFPLFVSRILLKLLCPA